MKRCLYIIPILLFLAACTMNPANQASGSRTSGSILEKGLKVYTNVDKGYSYTYPENWIEKGGDLYEKTTESPPTIQFTVQEKDYYETHSRNIAIDAEIGSKKDIGNGVTEKKVDNLAFGKYRAGKYADTVTTKGKNDAVDSLVIRIDMGKNILESRLFLPGGEEKNAEKVKVFSSVMASVSFK